MKISISSKDGVKTTLETLRQAGIKIWMLTGDKIETATCIALSSKLVTRHQTLFSMVKIKDPNVALEELDVLVHQKEACLIIDGESLQVSFGLCCILICCRRVWIIVKQSLLAQRVLSQQSLRVDVPLLKKQK